MFSITTETLENFRRLKGELMRASAYLASSETPMVNDALMSLQQGASALDVFNAFSKDMAKSVKYINTIANVLSKTDPNTGRCQELDGGDVDLREIFPINSAGQLKLMGMTLVIGQGFYADLKPAEIRQKVYENAMNGRSYAEFDKFYKLLKLEGQSDLDPNTTPFMERLEEAARLQSLEQVEVIAKDFLALAEKSFEIRQSMDGATKRKMDEVVYGGRAMIDGTTLASTYLTRNKDEVGNQQIASSHKKEPVAMKEIKQLFDQMPYINAMEIDPDTDVVKFRDMLQSIKDMNLSNIEPFELKSRKLGNYGASGLFAQRDVNGQLSLAEEYGYSSSKLKIVAVDVRAPTSLAHELGHYADTPSAPNASIRQQMVKHFRSKLDLKSIANAYGQRYADYLGNDREVIARLSEIGYVLNQIEFDKDDTPEQIFAKVRNWEKDRTNEKFKDLLNQYVKKHRLPVKPRASVEEMQQAVINYQAADRAKIEASNIKRTVDSIGLDMAAFEGDVNQDSLNTLIKKQMNDLMDQLPNDMTKSELEEILKEFYRKYDMDGDKYLRTVRKKAKESGVNVQYAEFSHLADMLFKYSPEIEDRLENTHENKAKLAIAMSGFAEFQGYNQFRNDDLVKESTLSALSASFDGQDFKTFIVPLLNDYIESNDLLEQSWFIDRVNKIRASGGQVSKEFVLKQVNDSFFSHVASQFDQTTKTTLYGMMKADGLFNAFLSQAIDGRYKEFGIEGFADVHDISAYVDKKQETLLLGNDVNYHVKVAKDLSKYLSDPAYFDMAAWKTDELMLVRDYAHGFYYTPHPNAAQALQNSMKGVSQSVVTSKQLNDSKRFQYHRALTDTEKRRKAWHSLPTAPHKMGQLLEIGMDKELFLPGEFGFMFAQDIDVLYRKTPKGKLSRLGLSAQFTALDSVVDVAKDKGLDADVRGLKAILNAYPRVTGVPIDEARKDREILFTLNGAKSNEAFLQAGLHSTASWQSVNDRRNREQAWVDTLKKLSHAYQNIPQIHPEQTYMPVKAMAFVDAIQRADAPKIVGHEVEKTIYQHQEKAALEHMAYEPIEHTENTRVIGNTALLEGEIVVDYARMGEMALEVIKKLGVDPDLNVEDLPVIQAYNKKNGTDLRNLSECLVGGKALNAQRASIMGLYRDRVGYRDEVTPEQARQISAMSLAGSILHEGFEHQLISSNHVDQFYDLIGESLLSDNPKNDALWSRAESGLREIRNAQYVYRFKGLDDIISPHIATICGTKTEDGLKIKPEIKKMITEAMLDEMKFKTLTNSTHGGYVRLAGRNAQVQHLAVPAGFSESDILSKGLMHLDNHLSTISRGLIKLRGDDYQVDAPEAIKSSVTESKAYFDKMTESHSKEFVDALMSYVQNTPYPTVMKTLDTPMVNAAFALQAGEWGYQGPEPELSEQEIEALKDTMKKAALKIFGEENILDNIKEEVKQENEKPEVKVEEKPEIKERPAYTGTPTQIKLF